MRGDETNAAAYWMRRAGDAEVENERLSQRLTDVRVALDNEYLEPVDKLVAIRRALGAQPADWQAIQKKVQETAKKAREASKP